MSSSRQRLALAQPAQRREPHRGQAGRLDRRHIPAAALDAQHLGGFADEVGRHRLDRGVAAAVQHQLRVAAEQARGVDAQRQVAADPGGGVVRRHRFGIAVRPQATHRPPPRLAPGLVDPLQRRRLALFDARRCFRHRPTAAAWPRGSDRRPANPGRSGCPGSAASRPPACRARRARHCRSRSSPCWRRCPPAAAAAPGAGGRRSKSGGIVSGARDSTANSSGESPRYRSSA